MPGMDGTGPQGTGPMTGGGRGYCAIVLPPPDAGQAPYGFAGLQGTPVQLSDPAVAPRGILPWGRRALVGGWRRWPRGGWR